MEHRLQWQQITMNQTFTTIILRSCWTSKQYNQQIEKKKSEEEEFGFKSYHIIRFKTTYFHQKLGGMQSIAHCEGKKEINRNVPLEVRPLHFQTKTLKSTALKIHKGLKETQRTMIQWIENINKVTNYKKIKVPQKKF